MDRQQESQRLTGQQQLKRASRTRRSYDVVADDELTPSESAKAWHWRYGLEASLRPSAH